MTILPKRRELNSTQMLPKISYFICTLPRSGSWLLCESLERTGIAGRPREYIDPAALKDQPISKYRPHLEAILDRGMTSNGVFGIKFHWFQFEFACGMIQALPEVRTTVLARGVRQIFGDVRYVWLTRRDKARQAVSYYRASRTGQWWKIDGTEVPGSSGKPKDVPFDYVEINRLYKVLLAHETKWYQFFEESGITPLVLPYEQLAVDYKGVTRELMESIGLEMPTNLRITTRLQRQSDSRSDEWAHRFLTISESGSDPYIITSKFVPHDNIGERNDD
jgi:LPS sulfotransferase NodH